MSLSVGNDLLSETYHNNTLTRKNMRLEWVDDGRGLVRSVFMFSSESMRKIRTAQRAVCVLTHESCMLLKYHPPLRATVCVFICHDIMSSFGAIVS